MHARSATTAPTLPVHAPDAAPVFCEPLESRTLFAADAVLDWNAAALDAIRADKPRPPLRPSTWR